MPLTLIFYKILTFQGEGDLLPLLCELRWDKGEYSLLLKKCYERFWYSLDWDFQPIHSKHVQHYNNSVVTNFHSYQKVKVISFQYYAGSDELKVSTPYCFMLWEILALITIFIKKKKWHLNSLKGLIAGSSCD